VLLNVSLSQQTTRYHDLIAACLAQSRCAAVTTWGISDQCSFMNDLTDIGCTGTEKPGLLRWLE
jgi:GH35 family endo-1,4-beta-xylanase